MYQFKLGCKAAETARNIKHAFDQGAINERTVQYRLKKFRDGNESLKCEEDRGQPSTIGNTDLRPIIEVDPHKTTRVLGKEYNVNHSTIVRYLSLIGKTKKLDKCVVHELNEQQAL